MLSTLALLFAALLAVSAQTPWTPTAETLRIGDTQTGVYDDATTSNWDNGVHCSGSFLVGTQNLGDYLKQNFAGISSVGGYACRQNVYPNLDKMSAHGTGRAIDVMIPMVGGNANNAVGDPIAKYLVENAQRLGVQYFIWDRMSWKLSNSAGNKFGTYLGSSWHVDHIHVELTIAAASRVGFLPVVATTRPAPKTTTPTPAPPVVTPATNMRTYKPTFTGPSASTIPPSTYCVTPISGRLGACLIVNDCPGATFNTQGGVPCLNNLKCCVADPMTISYDVTVVPRALFTQAFGGVSGLRADAMHAHLSKAMKDGGITSCLCKAAFMAQVGTESGGLARFEENASGAAYEGRKDLGNVKTGDGVRYKGRGPITLTGRANYRDVPTTRGADYDLEDDPELVCFPSVGFTITVNYWNSLKLNQYCVKGDSAEFVEMTKRINGGKPPTKLADRQTRYADNRKTLGC